MFTLSSLSKDYKPSIVRILAKNRKEETCVGTGFYLQKDVIVTCAHVLFDTGNLRTLQKNSNETFEEYFKSNISSVIAQDYKRREIPISTIQLLPDKDLAFLRTEESSHLSFPQGSNAQIGEEIFFCGYQQAIQTKKEKNPYAVMKGDVSTFVKAQVGGVAKNNLMQLHVFMLGGASGSPVFSLEDGRLVGILNGYMNWGAKNICMLDEDDKKKSIVEDLFVPIPLAFATPIKDVMNALLKTSLPPQKLIRSTGIKRATAKKSNGFFLISTNAVKRVAMTIKN